MIEIENVTKRFGEFTAVDQVSLQVEAGEFITLLGPSGCGKTTLLRMLSGFEVPDAGIIRLGGEDVTFLPPYRRNVNQVFQGYALFPHLNVRANIAFGLRMQKVPKAEAERRIDEVIALVALQGFEERKPAQLSGGQRQRVALARAIVPRPSVLLLDEPLSALDAKLRGQMQLELKRLQQHLGLTFVFVTHDQEEALTMSDRIAVMHQGKIEQLGTAAEIYHRPRTAFVADFIGEANLLPAARIDASATSVRVSLEGGLRLDLPAAKWPAGKSEGLLSIRPEKLHLSRPPIFGDNVFGVRVTERVFLGTFNRLSLEVIETETRLTALVANESALRDAFQVGDALWCALHADDVVVV